MFDYTLIMKCELTSVVVHLTAYLTRMDWQTVCRSSLICFGELLEDSLELPRLLLLVF